MTGSNGQPDSSDVLYYQTEFVYKIQLAKNVRVECSASLNNPDKVDIEPHLQNSWIDSRLGEAITTAQKKDGDSNHDLLIKQLKSDAREILLLLEQLYDNCILSIVTESKESWSRYKSDIEHVASRIPNCPQPQDVRSLIKQYNHEAEKIRNLSKLAADADVIRDFHWLDKEQESGRLYIRNKSLLIAKNIREILAQAEREKLNYDRQNRKWFIGIIITILTSGVVFSIWNKLINS